MDTSKKKSKPSGADLLRLKQAKENKSSGESPFSDDLDDTPNASLDKVAVKIAEDLAEKLGGIEKLKAVFPDMAALLESKDDG